MKRDICLSVYLYIYNRTNEANERGGRREKNAYTPRTDRERERARAKEESVVSAEIRLNGKIYYPKPNRKDFNKEHQQQQQQRRQRHHKKRISIVFCV